MEQPAKADSPTAAWLKPGVLAVSLAVLLTAGGGTLLGFAARYAWQLELASHFRVQYFWALAVAALALALVRYRKLAAAAAVLAAVNLLLIVPLYFGPAPRADIGQPLRAMSFNVHYLNDDYGATLELIAGEMPDFVLLLEVTDDWVDALEFLKPDYPYHHELPAPYGSGMALYSRHKIVDVEEYRIPELGLPTIVVEVETPGGPLTLLCTHPASPESTRGSEARNLQLEQVAQLAREQKGPVVLLGDLNTTSWSPFFQDLLIASGLRDSRRGFGVEPSWPSWLPTALLRLPIDHCLVSEAVSILDRRIGPNAGSDHLPLLVEFALPAP